ncbi:MAG: class I SAM-dependent methyltransferase [Mizugakiibacter sp.]|uniref:class I SAM-dependent methyltransferase n=1 Tax=Mizugakiibacter sp. TaxID=1972610 RepID=UPI0031C58CF5|nr:class I SAM-dependent methyltransferase [Xanthomonadaceae bacterium]
MGLLTPYLTKARTSRIASYIHGDVLDLGCGSLGRAAILEQYGKQTTSYCGVERSEESVQQLRDRYPNFQFFARDLDRDSLALDRKFDCILMVALIEHLFNQQHVMSEVANALKPGGIIVMTTPTPFGNDVVHRLGASIGLFAKAAVDDHIVIYNHHRFRLMAKEVDLQLKSYRKFQFFCNQIAVLART